MTRSLVTANEMCSLYFLTEHELPSGLKRSMSKRGKGKEKLVPQTHYPIVLLLGLLDKPTILKTSSLMDLLAALLASITRPLTTLKDSPNAAPVPAAPSEGTVVSALPPDQPSSDAAEGAAPGIWTRPTHHWRG